MIGEWDGNSGAIALDVASSSKAVIMVMFNGGLDKAVEIRDSITNDLLHLIRSTDMRPTPATRMLEHGQSYSIQPTYMAGNMPKNDFNVRQFPDSLLPGEGVVTHRDFRVVPNGNPPQKISITIVLVDDDVSPRGRISPPEAGADEPGANEPGADDPKSSSAESRGAQGGYGYGEQIEREHLRVPFR